MRLASRFSVRRGPLMHRHFCRVAKAPTPSQHRDCEALRGCCHFGWRLARFWRAARTYLKEANDAEEGHQARRRGGADVWGACFWRRRTDRTRPCRAFRASSKLHANRKGRLRSALGSLLWPVASPRVRPLALLVRPLLKVTMRRPRRLIKRRERPQLLPAGFVIPAQTGTTRKRRRLSARSSGLPNERKTARASPYPVTSSASRPLNGWPYSPVASTTTA
jgi:hypothetical protein